MNIRECMMRGEIAFPEMLCMISERGEFIKVQNGGRKEGGSVRKCMMMRR